MDILLIDPPRKYWGFGGGEGFFAQPLGLATLAGFLEENDVDVDVLDCNMLRIGWDDLGDEIKKRKPWCVGVSSSMTCFVRDSFKCAQLAKQIDPEIHTIGGGLQLSLSPEESLRRCQTLDFVVRGDGEYTCLDLMKELRRRTPRLENVKGLSYRKDGEIVHNEDRPPIANLDDLPFPAWHLLPMKKYRLPLIPPKWGNFSVVVTSRGCPYKCSFCSPRVGQKPYRMMGAKKAADMIEQLHNEHDIRVFWVNDLSFNVDRERTEHFLDELIERKLGVRMAIDGTRTDLLIRDQDLIRKMKKAGVFMVNLGVESYSDEELSSYNKETSLENARRAVGLLKKSKIHSWIFMMIGNWTHDERDILNILEYAKKLDPTVAIFAVVTPIPGTTFYDEMVEKGLVEEFDWSLYDLAHPVMRTSHLSRNQVLDLVYRVYSGFYKRPRKIIKHIIMGDAFARYTYKTARGMGQLFLKAARDLTEDPSNSAMDS